MVFSIDSGSNHKNYAVCVQHMSKSYEKDVPVLRDVTMHVEHGIIYGLLGSSGCGKSTLLSCILNLKEWDTGEVFVFGRKLCKAKEINFKAVGYMPQDLAMYDHLTVEEMMKYFSKLYGMNHTKFKERMKFLEDLIDLKSFKSRRIINLSGGEKRRVSMSLTLIHNPKLLILDEPTVGLDPLLRERFWNYLNNLTLTTKTTVIISTHYIEEVKRASKIGLMRKGRILVEEDPALLMRRHNTVILEEVVRNLCYQDTLSQKPSMKSIPNNVLSTFKSQKHFDFSADPVTLLHNYCEVSGALQPQEFNLNSKDEGLTWKNSILAPFKRSLAYSHITWINFMRNPMFVILVLFLPPFQLLTSGVVIGVEPKYTSIGVVNNELPNWSDSCPNLGGTGGYGNSSKGNMKCDVSTLSCDFIRHLKASSFINPVQFLNKDEALYAVSQGDIHGYIQIPKNFSQNIIERAALFRFASSETIQGTEIEINMDFTDYITTIIVMTRMHHGFFNSFVKELTEVCNFDLKFLDIPFLYRHPVYGKIDGGSAQDYALPAMIPGIIFIITFAVTPLVLINDMKTGVLERTKTAGLRSIEWMIGLVLTMGIMAFLQAFMCFVALEYILNFTFLGDPFTYVAICFAISLCGGTFGLFFGVIVKDALTIILIAIFLFPVAFLHMGVLSPDESLPRYYRTLAYYCFPTTAMAKAIRFVLNRGLGLGHPQVWVGMLITLGWSAVYSLLSLLIFKRGS